MHAEGDIASGARTRLETADHRGAVHRSASSCRWRIKAAGCSSPATQATAGIPPYAPSCRQVLLAVCAVGVCYFARAIDGS
jgi:hypothetical protein